MPHLHNTQRKLVSRRWLSSTQQAALISVLGCADTKESSRRAAIVNCCGGRRKLVPPTGPRKGLMNLHVAAGSIKSTALIRRLRTFALGRRAQSNYRGTVTKSEARPVSVTAHVLRK